MFARVKQQRVCAFSSATEEYRVCLMYFQVKGMRRRREGGWECSDRRQLFFGSTTSTRKLWRVGAQGMCGLWLGAPRE